MPDVRAAWQEVGDAIEALALKVKLHVEEQSGATAESVQSALSAFGEGLRRAADAVADTLGDAALQEDARRVGSSLAAAVSATWSEVTESVREGARRDDGDDD